MVTGPDSKGFTTIDMMGSVMPESKGGWAPLDIDSMETGEVTVEPLTLEEARADLQQLLLDAREALDANDEAAAKSAAFAISILEDQFPELAPRTD